MEIRILLLVISLNFAHGQAKFQGTVSMMIKMVLLMILME